MNINDLPWTAYPWAKFAAMDPDFFWWFFEVEPFLWEPKYPDDKPCWACHKTPVDQKVARAGLIKGPYPDWKNSLSTRPTDLPAAKSDGHALFIAKYADIPGFPGAEQRWFNLRQETRDKYERYAAAVRANRP